MRGNVIELAVAVVVGAAFTGIVTSVVEGVINPMIGAFGTQDLDKYELCLTGDCDAAGGAAIRWGSVLTASLTFLMTAAVVYFLMIMPMNRFNARRAAKAGLHEEPVSKTELEILIEIRDELIAQRAAGTEAGTEGAPALVGQRGAPNGASGEDTGADTDTASGSGSGNR
ncbi:MscL family protein [Streptomyces sp. JH002]